MTSAAAVGVGLSAVVPYQDDQASEPMETNGNKGAQGCSHLIVLHATAAEAKQLVQDVVIAGLFLSFGRHIDRCLR
jgi:hypothetical protein